LLVKQVKLKLALRWWIVNTAVLYWVTGSDIPYSASSLVSFSGLPAAGFIDPNKTLQHCIMYAEHLHFLRADSPFCINIWFGVFKQMLSL
jgi:hypothetical protein